MPSMKTQRPAKDVGLQTKQSVARKASPAPAKQPADGEAKPAANGGRQPDHRQILLERRREILANLGMKFDTIAVLGRVAEEDQAQLSHDEFIYLQMNSLDYEKLRLVDEALDRLETGEYGICQRCEEPISPKRLQAIPWAKYCVQCQERIGESQKVQPELVPLLS